jgi:hypothetical protein
MATESEGEFSARVRTSAAAAGLDRDLTGIRSEGCGGRRHRSVRCSGSGMSAEVVSLPRIKARRRAEARPWSSSTFVLDWGYR